MTQDEFREAMNKAKRENRLLWVDGDDLSGVALGYDSGTNEVILFKDQRIPLDQVQIDEP